VAVTGAAGFIGSHVADALVARGHEVLALDDLSTGRLSNLEQAGATGRLRFEEIDITSPAVMEPVREFAPDAVCHLAASIDVRTSVADPVEDARVNLLGTIRVLEAARVGGASAVVFVSSGGAIYGETPPGAGASETSPLAPESPYGAGKAAAELWLGVYQRLHDLKWTALALSNVYGPRQAPDGEGGVVSVFGTRSLSGIRATVYGDGAQTRDFVYVGDVADAVVLALDVPGAGRLNIGTGASTSVLDLHGRISHLCGGAPDPEFAPPRPGEVLRSVLDASAASRVLGWRPATALDEGLARTLDWLRTAAPAARR
jgi:UDP-glucose 4-epimerase